MIKALKKLIVVVLVITMLAPTMAVSASNSPQFNNGFRQSLIELGIDNSFMCLLVIWQCDCFEEDGWYHFLLLIFDTHPHRLNGEYWDFATGTYYLRARNYDPHLGRFTQEDPIRWGHNWYCYAMQNPIMFGDPSGLAPVNMIDYAEAMGATTRRSTVNGVDRVTITYNDISHIFLLGDGYINDSILNRSFGWGSFLTDAERQAGVGIGIVNGNLYRDITTPFLGLMERAANTAAARGAFNPADLLWFAGQFTDGGDWDIKNAGSWARAFPGITYVYNDLTPTIMFMGYHKNLHEMGNILYGYVGTAMGIPQQILLEGGNFQVGAFVGGNAGEAIGNVVGFMVGVPVGFVAGLFGLNPVGGARAGANIGTSVAGAAGNLAGQAVGGAVGIVVRADDARGQQMIRMGINLRRGR